MSENCSRCETPEIRIDGYCSIYCRDIDEEATDAKRYRKALEAAPDISNCNTLGYVEWYKGIRKEALEGDE